MQKKKKKKKKEEERNKFYPVISGVLGCIKLPQSPYG